LAPLESTIDAPSTVDRFCGQPFRYKADNAGGYLLYSVFYNGTDDGGTDGDKLIFEGEWVSEREPVDYFNESDYVIRVPRPTFHLPTPWANP
jgi:hypothetical protein